MRITSSTSSNDARQPGNVRVTGQGPTTTCPNRQWPDTGTSSRAKLAIAEGYMCSEYINK